VGLIHYLAFGLVLGRFFENAKLYHIFRAYF
jgi:hypothetical protein